MQCATVAAVPYTFMGCYNDGVGRALPHMLQVAAADMNAAICYNLAVAGGFTFFGTQYASECWAGNDESRATMFGVGTCDTICNNHGDETCGGSLVNSLYRVIQTTGDVQLPHACCCMRAC
jgi:hypothetical protein